jgi:glutathione reductase (NADPH)
MSSAAHVTIVNRSDTILRGYDESIRDRLLQISMAKGIDFRFNSPVEKIQKCWDGTLSLRIKEGDPITCDLLIFATGRVPNTTNLRLETAGVELDDSGAIIVDEYSKTTCKSIYAVGDVTNRAQLTPIAVREGHAFADTVFGGTPRAIDYGCIPTAVFSHPPLAAVGMTEAQARNKLGDIRVFISDFQAMKNVLANRNERALYKMIVDATTDEVVGLHMIGPDAPEILQASAVAVKAGLTKRDFDATVALHPTMAEELVLLK